MMYFSQIGLFKVSDSIMKTKGLRWFKALNLDGDFDEELDRHEYELF